MNKWELARRNLLKGLGVGIGCIPLLHASEAWAAPATAPKRLLIVMNTNGYRQMYWQPKLGPTATQTLPDSTSPLEPYKASIIFCPDMTNPAYGGGGHGAYVNCLAAGPNDNLREYRVPFTPTIDQIVGPVLAQAGGLDRVSLPLGVQIAGGNAGIFPSKRMCWKDKDTPITPQEDVYAAYADVFAGGDKGPTNAVAAKSMMAHKKSLLDYVGTAIDRFKVRLGNDDRQVIESHLQSVRDLETQMAAPKADLTKCGQDPGMPEDVKAAGNWSHLFDLSMDLMVAAIKCDLTRVATLSPNDASGSNISFAVDNPKVNRGWHSIAHNPIAGGIDQKQLADKVLMGKFGTLIERLKAPDPGGGTLLDNTIVLWGNHMEEGSNHNSQKTPWMIAGNVNGYFKLGQCAPSAGNPINGVLYHICHALGVPVDYFGTPDFGKGWDGLTA